MSTRKFTFTVSVLLVIIFSSVIYLRTSLANDFSDNGDFDNYVGRVFMSAEFPDEELLRIAVKADEMAVPVLGIAFHLEYDSEDIAFLRYLPGDFLERGGSPFYIVRPLPEENKIIFGETLRHDDSFPVGSGDIAYFDFQILSGDEWDFRFDRGVLSGTDTPRQDIDKVLWEDLWVDNSSQDGYAINGIVGGLLSGGEASGEGTFSSFSIGRVVPVLLFFSAFLVAVRLFRHKKSTRPVLTQ